jgi:hypothetical protein
MGSYRRLPIAAATVEFCNRLRCDRPYLDRLRFAMHEKGRRPKAAPGRLPDDVRVDYLLGSKTFDFSAW